MIKLAIIIPTFNSSNFLPTVLNSITLQKCNLLIEVIIADNGSSDETKKIALDFGAKFIHIGSPPPQVNRQRNMGAYASDADYFYFLDHDMELMPGLLYEIEVLINNSIGNTALYVAEHIKSSSLFFSRVRNFERAAYGGTDIDGVRIVNRELFYEIGGFDELLSHGPGDWDFDIRIKKRCPKFHLTKKMVIHHEESIGIFRYFIKRSNYSCGIQSYIKKWSDDEDGRRALKNQFGIYSRAFKLFFCDDAYKRTLKNIHLYLLFLIMKTTIYALYRIKGGK